MARKPRGMILGNRAFWSLLFAAKVFALSSWTSAQSELIEDAPATTMGSILLKGEGLMMVELYGAGRRVKVSSFDEPTVVPAGQYHLQMVVLKGDISSRKFPQTEPIQVNAGQATMLQVGGPLKPSITYTQFAHVLTLRYSLRGQAGGEYNDPRAGTRRSSRPAFSAFLHGRPIAAGRFKYG